ncbi:Major Vault Protein repeatcontaining protein [Acanthamoeba castellanii str. Neff]|uniref:Major Vault Protein repeatcontaining protein n=1 Tax=Acanthamoeba castellanii (strain ATCC 30010 / Neff) TaxID=1257118 RepID=L8GQU5_ACACF|nr:Major Vault Protein repeatcontaining protein [Acanthamoeba castellanii str. Neff]ELR15365.1 Major Vault Protein repeatcontaining protein [Acanthamoeba castellanii str. Neff]
MSRDPNVIRIKPYHYIHVLDNNTNVTRVEVGPNTYTRQDAKNQPVFDGHHNVKVRFGDEEIRFEQEPFPLYPGELLRGKVSALQVVGPDAALRLRAIRDFEDKVAGDEWLFRGPATYKPRVEVQVVEIIRSTIVKPNTALKLRARKAAVDSAGTKREAGEEWLVRTVGAYLPGVDEEIVQTVPAKVLTDKKALHLRATKTFTDVYGTKRKAGEEWLVTLDDAETHLPDVYEEVVGEVRITTLSNRQYTVVLDPLDKNGHPQLGLKHLRVGPASFFLRPGERLEAGIQNIYVLAAEEALLLRSREAYQDGALARKPGDRWMIVGPCDYVPPIEVDVLETRRSIPLDENEGIYVRDLNTGKVRAVIGESYMLKADEELWEKQLPQVVEDLLSRERTSGEVRSATWSNARGGVQPAVSARDKTRLVTYRAPHGAAVQIYDYKEKKARIVFGPELVTLGPEEQFTVADLSGDVPKRPNVIKSLALQLGPDYMTDIVTVETADHARLSLKLSYNWHFEVDKANPQSAASIFRVPDFVGDGCKAIASRVRGAVAQASFDDFHKMSSDVIRAAVRNRFFFSANHLVITNIDIQSVEPVDQRTRDSLQKSVQLAIEITTKSQEASAKHEAARLEQEAKGRLERQKINDEAEAEKARKSLLQLQAQSAAVESTGQATAEAKARAEAAQIEGEAAVTMSKLKAQSTKIKSADSSSSRRSSSRRSTTARPWPSSRSTRPESWLPSSPRSSRRSSTPSVPRPSRRSPRPAPRCRPSCSRAWASRAS